MCASESIQGLAQWAQIHRILSGSGRYTLVADSATQLKKLADDLAAASSVKADLDQQVTKLTEELAGSAKEVSTLKEEA